MLGCECRYAARSIHARPSELGEQLDQVRVRWGITPLGAVPSSPGTESAGGCSAPQSKWRIRRNAGASGLPARGARRPCYPQGCLAEAVKRPAEMHNHSSAHLLMSSLAESHCLRLNSYSCPSRALRADPHVASGSRTSLRCSPRGCGRNIRTRNVSTSSGSNWDRFRTEAAVPPRQHGDGEGSAGRCGTVGGTVARRVPHLCVEDHPKKSARFRPGGTEHVPLSSTPLPGWWAMTAGSCSHPSLTVVRTTPPSRTRAEECARHVRERPARGR